MTVAVSPRMRERLDDYSGYHRTLGNEVCHFLGIPSIIAGTATLFGELPLATVAGFTLTPAEPIAAAIAVFYCVSARWLGVVTSLLLIAFVALGRLLPLPVGIAVFVAGWVFQGVGHAAYEKRSPAFLRNLLHLLVGPAWIVERALARLGR